MTSCGCLGPCDSKGYGLGECVSYVATVDPLTSSWVPNNFGSAYQWLNKARAAGYPISSTPVVGSVACWPSSFASGFGHVAVVDSVSAGGFTVREENVKGCNVVSSRSFTGTGGASGFILPKGGAAVGSPSNPATLSIAPTTLTGTLAAFKSCGKTLTGNPLTDCTDTLGGCYPVGSQDWRDCFYNHPANTPANVPGKIISGIFGGAAGDPCSGLLGGLNPACVAQGVAAGIAGVFGAFFASIGHGIANALVAVWDNVGTAVRAHAVPIAVATVVILVLFIL